MRTAALKVRSRANLAICAGLAAVTLATYWPATGFDFINYDDQDYVTENKVVLRGLNWGGVVWAFRTGEAANWHPLTWLSHMLDVQLFGLQAGWHHLTNLFFHTANTLLLFGLLNLMTSGVWRSAFVAALFALHPLHVESVAWIAERKDVLSTCFGFLSLWAYVGYAKSRKPKAESRKPNQESPNDRAVTLHARRSTLCYMAALACFGLSLMSKPMLVTLPFLLMLLDFWPLGRLQLSTLKTQLSSLLWDKLPFLMLAAVSSVVTFHVQREGSTVAPLGALPIGVRLANALVAYFRYVSKMFWPSDLSIIYPLHGGLPASGLVLLAGAFMVGVSGIALVIARKQPWFAVGWFWFVGTLVPVIGLVQVGLQAMADRYTYFPLIGLFILLAWSVPEWTARWRHGPSGLALAGAGAGLLCLCLSRSQLSWWRNTETVFRRASAVTPDNYVATFNLASALEKQGKIDEAGAEYAVVAKLAYEQGKLAEAAALFKKVLGWRPSDPEACQNLASVLASQGQLDQAIALYQEALRIRPDYEGARVNLAAALAQQQKWVEASARYEAGVTLLKQQRTQEAIAEFHQALRLRSDWPEVLNNLAWLLATHPDAAARNGPEAVSLAERACALTGTTNYSFVSTLAAAYAEASRFSNAVTVQQRACELAAASGATVTAETLQQRLQLYRAGHAYHRE